MIPDWRLPPGVDRGLWDYLHSADMVSGYDGQMAASPLAKADVAFCERFFPTPGRLLDMGCGTGRLCRHFAAKGYECVGVDLSDEMLAEARSRNLTPQPPSLERKGEPEEVDDDSSPSAARMSALAPPSFPGKGVGGSGSATFVQANLVDLAGVPDASFDSAACLFSTLGMVRGADNRAKVLANAFRVLKPGGKFVLHVHNRFFAGLGFGRVCRQFGLTLFERKSAGDVTMPQAYGGAPLTLHHFLRREAMMMLWEAGFATLDGLPLTTDGERAGWPTAVRAYGWLIAAERPV